MKKKITHSLKRAIPGIAILLASTALTAYASVIFTNPAGLTTKTFNSSGFDGAGDTIAVTSGFGIFENSGGEVLAMAGSSTVTFTFASPLATFGFDMGSFGAGTITGVTLSNGDVLTTSVPYNFSGSSFYGITSGSNFTSAAVSFNASSSDDIADFRLGAAAGTPEPATLALVAPLLLAGLAGLRLRKRAVR